MYRAILVALSLVVILTACTVPLSPDRVDAFSGIIDITKVPQGPSHLTAAEAKHGRLAIITSASTSKQIEYSSAYFKEFRDNPFNMGKYRETFELAKPGYFANLIVSQLKDTFGEVVIAHDIDDARSKGARWIAIIDLALRYPDNFVYTYRYEVDAHFIDLKPQQMFSIVGIAEETNTCSGQGSDCLPATATRLMKSAYEKFQTNLHARIN